MADFQVSDANPQIQTDLRFAALPGGGFVAVWYDMAAGQIRAQRFNDNGRETGSEFVVNQIKAGVQPSVAALSSGGFVVTWGEENPYPANFDLKGQIFDANGARIGTEFRYRIPRRSGSRSLSVVTALTGGGFAVTWLQRNMGRSTISGARFLRQTGEDRR